MRTARSRAAMTLLELLVAIAIIAILLSFLFVGVMRVRESAAIAQSKNNVRQIVLGVHHYAAAHQGRLPPVGDGPPLEIRPRVFHPGKHAPPVLVHILPYVEAQAQFNGKIRRFAAVPLFLSPGDPTAAQALAKNAPVSSYAANAEAFKDEGLISATFLDGTSNTIAFAEHYAFDCDGFPFPYWHGHAGFPHRATFADRGDVRPITQGNPPVTVPSAHLTAPVSTFQVAPRTKDCRFCVAQTPHTSGMVVAFADGSVRQLAPSIGISIFWGAVTPNKGEILGGDW